MSCRFINVRTARSKQASQLSKGVKSPSTTRYKKSTLRFLHTGETYATLWVYGFGCKPTLQGLVNLAQRCLGDFSLQVVWDDCSLCTYVFETLANSTDPK